MSDSEDAGGTCSDGTERQAPIECLEPPCESEAKYVCESPDGSKIPVCYKHSLQFAPAKVRPLETDAEPEVGPDE